MKQQRPASDNAEPNPTGLRTFWLAGQHSLEVCSLQSVRHGNKVEELEKELERMRRKAPKLELMVTLNIDTLGKMRRLPIAYSLEEIELLEQLVQQYQAPFSTTHLIELLKAPTRKKRMHWAKTAIKKKWSTRALKKYLLANSTQRRKAGRMPKMPDDPKERLIDLEALCLRWLNWAEHGKDELPASVKKLLPAAEEAIRAVKSALKKHLACEESAEA